MKKLYVILNAVILLCMVGTAVFLILSPGRVPVHYNALGEVDRIGSKFEYLVFPLFAVGFGAFFRLMARQPRKTGQATNEKILLYAGIAVLIFFTLLGFYYMRKAIRGASEPERAVSYDEVNRFVNLGLGALLIVLGNIMPKARRNSLFGIRTKWSMANDAVWQKSQRFGGIASVIAGACLIVLSLVLPGIWNVPALIVVITVLLVLCVTRSRRFYLEDSARDR